MSEDKHNARIIVPMPSTLLERIDKVWHERALMSRSATIRALLEEALKAAPERKST